MRAEFLGFRNCQVRTQRRTHRRDDRLHFWPAKIIAERETEETHIVANNQGGFAGYDLLDNWFFVLSLGGRRGFNHFFRANPLRQRDAG